MLRSVYRMRTFLLSHNWKQIKSLINQLNYRRRYSLSYRLIVIVINKKNKKYRIYLQWILEQRKNGKDRESSMYFVHLLRKNLEKSEGRETGGIEDRKENVVERSHACTARVLANTDRIYNVHVRRREENALTRFYHLEVSRVRDFTHCTHCTHSAQRRDDVAIYAK